MIAASSSSSAGATISSIIGVPAGVAWGVAALEAVPLGTVAEVALEGVLWDGESCLVLAIISFPTVSFVAEGRPESGSIFGVDREVSSL